MLADVVLLNEFARGEVGPEPAVFELARWRGLSAVDMLENRVRASGKLGGVAGVLAGVIREKPVLGLGTVASWKYALRAVWNSHLDCARI